MAEKKKPPHWVKCPYCQERFDANITPFVKVGGGGRRYAHEACAIANAPEPVEPKVLTKEEQALADMIDYIRELFHIDDVNAKMWQQIHSYKTKYKFTYFGMLQALLYFYDVKENSIEKANGSLGIIPYIYDDAKVYWKAVWAAKQKNEGKPIEQIISQEREIRIAAPSRNTRRGARVRPGFIVEEEDTTWLRNM